MRNYVWGVDSGGDNLRLYAKMFYYMGEQYLDTFGEEGEKALRKAVQVFGASRGRALRERHHELGLDINMLNLFTVYDLPNEKDHDENRQQIQLDTENRVSETYQCHLHDTWYECGGIDKGQKIGQIYCQEFHWSMWAAYHPDIVTELPKILTIGTPCCHFEVHRHLNETSAERLAQIEKEEEATKIKSDYKWGEDPVNDGQRLLAKLYYILADEMIKAFGDEGVEAVKRAVRNYGIDRGNRLRERHWKAGYPINVKSLFTHYDLPSGKDWAGSRNLIQLDEDNRVSETFHCHFHDVWVELGGEDRGNWIGSLYCDNFHPAMWAAYSKDIVTELPLLLTKKDKNCRFEVHRKAE